MPKFAVEIEREVPSYRERAVILIEADSADDIEDNFDFDWLDEEELDWNEVFEGHGGFPCDYSIRSIEKSDSTEEADFEITD